MHLISAGPFGSRPADRHRPLLGRHDHTSVGPASPITSAESHRYHLFIGTPANPREGPIAFSTGLPRPRLHQLDPGRGRHPASLYYQDPAALLPLLRPDHLPGAVDKPVREDQDPGNVATVPWR